MMPDLPILFVDDEPDVLRALVRTTQHHGWRAVQAATPEEGLAAIEREEFAVVVSDFRMPKMDGVEFLARVRARWPNAERLLLSAFSDEGALERGINDAAISRFLRKPWRHEVLVAVIAKAMETSRVRREHAVLTEQLRQRNEELSYLNQRLQDRIDEKDRTLVSFRRRWDVALDAISDAIIVVTPNHRLEGANAAALALAGAALGEIEGRLCHVQLFGSREVCIGCPLMTGSSRLRTSRHGHEAIYDGRSYLLPGAAPTHLCIYRDITTAVAFETEAAQMEKMAAVGRLAGGVAHEINNPLHGVLSFVQLAEKPNVPPDKLARYLEVIHESALRCRDIVQSLRDFSRQPKLGEQRQVSLEEVVRKALVLFGSARDVSLSLVSDQADAGPFCLGNANELQQVVVNLVQNAIDASPKGGRIEVAIAREGGELVLSVEDQGPGVPAEITDKMFEPFFTTKPAGVGTGLGLAISHKIMSDHHGSLRIGKADLGGARFEARLPAVEKCKGSTEES